MSDRFSVLSAVASHLGWDRDEMKEYRYHPTRTPCHVYSVENDYFTATKTARKPREVSDYYMGDWRWQEVPADGYAKAMGWHIWRRILIDGE